MRRSVRACGNARPSGSPPTSRRLGRCAEPLSGDDLRRRKGRPYSDRYRLQSLCPTGMDRLPLGTLANGFQPLYDACKTWRPGVGSVEANNVAFTNPDAPGWEGSLAWHYNHRESLLRSRRKPLSTASTPCAPACPETPLPTTRRSRRTNPWPWWNAPFAASRRVTCRRSMAQIVRPTCSCMRACLSVAHPSDGADALRQQRQGSRRGPARKPRRQGAALPAALAKSATGRAADGAPVHSFQTLLADLATLARNTVVTANAPDRPFTILTRPTPIQQKAFDLLGFPIACTQ